MIEITGVGGLNVPPGTTPARAKDEARSKQAVFEATDGVKISTAASALTGEESEIRQKKIEEVKARLEEGAYKLQATVLLVAARVSPYVG